MGIKPNRAQLFQFRLLVADEDLNEKDLTELAGSRAPPRKPQRQRSLWSFLTWQFVIAPIIAAASIIGNGHALAAEDQDDRADHQKGQPDAASDHDQAAAGTTVPDDDGRSDQTDSSLRLLAAAKASADRDGLPHEEHAGPAGAHDAVATASPAGDSEVGGSGLDADHSDHCKAWPHGCSATAESSSDASGDSSGIPTDTPQPIIVGELTAAGLSVDISVGGELNLALATPDVVSTLTTSLADILTTVGLSSSLDLKDYLGFDLHVNAGGELVANDLGAVLDLNPSFAVLNTVSTVVSAVANPVANVVNLAADGLPILDLGTSNPLDHLLGDDHHSIVGRLGNLASLIGNDDAPPGHSSDLTSVISSGDIGSGDPIAALVGKLDGNVLGSNSAALTKMLPDALAATPPGGESNTDLPVIAAVADQAHVSIVVDASAMLPGHSIDFPAPAPPEADVLFHGNSYSDYHVALQSAGPSSGIGSIMPTPISVSGIPDATPLAHVDAPVTNTAPSSSTGAVVQHADALLTHISTTLDDLSLRIHTH
jgi:hypothetical protein